MILLLACRASPEAEPEGAETGGDPTTSAGNADTEVETIAGESSGGGSTTTGADAPDLVVDCAGGGDFTTVSEAVATARSGDRIGLRPCVYEEDLDYRGKALDIYGLGDAGETVLRGSGEGPVVKAVRGESVGTRLAHVSLTGGGGDQGSALYVSDVIFTLEDVIVADNGKSWSPIYHSGSSLTLIDVQIHDNEGRRESYGIVADNGTVTAQNLELRCGDATYGIYQHTVMLLLDSEIDCAGSSYGIVVSGGELHARRSRVVADDVGIYGEDKDDTRNERM